MKPGIYRDIPNEEYHGGEGISKSGLDLIRKSPAHYRAVKTAANDNPRVCTAAQRLGTAFHTLVLEPKEFVKRYTLAPSRADVPDAIDERDELVRRVELINAGRLAKLPTTGAKAELVKRIVAEGIMPVNVTQEDLESAKGEELKAIIVSANEFRPGKLSTSGTRHDLAAILAAEGQPVTLWSDYMAEWNANNGDKEILTPEEFAQLRSMAAAVEAHPAAGKLLAGEGEAELSAYWIEKVTIDHDTGEEIEILCRVRPDKYRKDGIIIDLKSTLDASEDGFAKSIANFGYHVQDPYYRRGLAMAMRQAEDRTIVDEYQPPRAFVFIGVEKDACVVDGVAKGVAVYSLCEESRALGNEQWKTDLRTYAQCEKTGEWPGYAQNIRQIKLPAWQFAKAAKASAE